MAKRTDIKFKEPEPIPLEPVPEIASDEPLLSRLDWGAFWTATLITFGGYFASLAPTVTLEDAGELAVAGDWMGVPHPPGYPIWTFLAWIFARVFSFVTFRGQPNPAWSIALMSAFFGALASGVTAMLICRSGRDILRESRLAAHAVSARTESVICWVSGVVCSLMFAFSPVEWSQAVIVEVYALNAFFLVLIFLLTYLWLRHPSDRLLFVTAYLFGLGLTNYQVLLLAGVALVVAVAARDLDLFRDLVILGAPFVVVLALMKLEMIPVIVHPLHWTALLYLALNFGALALAWFLLPRGRTVATAFLLLELGVAFYAYMPIVSDLRNPPMNWGYPRTWEGFKHAISRGQYEAIVPSDVFSLNFIQQVGAYLEDLRGQFTMLAAPLGFLPFTVWEIKLGGRRIKALYAAIFLTVPAALIAVIEGFPRFAGSGLEAVYKLLFLCVLLLVGIGGLTLILSQGQRYFQQAVGRIRCTLSQQVMSWLILVGGGSVVVYTMLRLLANLVAVTAPLRAVPPAAPAELQLALAGTIGLVLVILAVPTVIGACIWLMHSRFELRMTIEERAQKWFIATMFGFVVMSLLLISLANLKLDIQDQFIQRVKFISSHILYAFWIGYGMVFGLTFADHIFRGNRLVRVLAIGTACLLPLIPIHENASNRTLIRNYGSAEQNGHDFGWQFGNYQLRGAEAVIEELEPAEEPLPNPTYPPPMEVDAVFYGGTDPGRFVPTYMIYSARVREDVYLITQNALADNTYMSVMRDLYGDRIWIPAPGDSAMAFHRYIEEVRSGKRPKNAQLTIEDGRVQVQGALGVMEINGILAQMIFERNNYRHAFYIEESYVIPWMYPYLTPHGLIMKIERDGSTNHLTEAVTRQDMDFWDWYSRRLMSNPKFLRDVVAQKSFSKLRSAIAGLYSNRGRMTHAEEAFQEARTLYPLSPEANFRLVHEVYMPQRRIDDAADVMARFGILDPGNSKVPEFLSYLESLGRMDRRMGELEGDLRGGKLDVSKALELAAIYQQGGDVPRLLGLAGGIMSNSNLPAVVFFRVGQLLGRASRWSEMDRAFNQCMATAPPETPAEVFLEMARLYAAWGNYGKMETALAQYLKRKPSDWKAWLDMAALQATSGQTNAALKALETAVQRGGEEAIAIVGDDPRFAPLRKQALNRARMFEMPDNDVDGSARPPLLR